ncbi:hypothetical protein QOZ80_4BG0349030 [Eleusine coracana subsp. coracana]|nr:hypothetical protein QOZ80_4BG0349030 [Eleusine coracana subsp. coracana]
MSRWIQLGASVLLDVDGDGSSMAISDLSLLLQDPEGMDPLGFLVVQFHYGGQFFSMEGHLQYFGDTTGMPYIEKRDNDWELEKLEVAQAANDEAYEGDDEPEKQVAMEKDLIACREFYKSPTKDEEDEESSDNLDSDFQPKDINSSGEDEEVEKLRNFAKQVKDNPTWKVDLIKKAVLKDLLCDVTTSQCKRVKALVLQEALSATKVMEKVFQRFYVCFDACKKGFLAGCRRVIGLDGCFFKGATNGELLCAIGRDANNQMYPIAWASVEKETYDSWFWFLGLLQKDLNISNGGEGWVLISD